MWNLLFQRVKESGERMGGQPMIYLARMYLTVFEAGCRLQKMHVADVPSSAAALHTMVLSSLLSHEII